MILSAPHSVPVGLLAEASQAPEAGSLPFLVNGAPCGVLRPLCAKKLFALPAELTRLFRKTNRGIEAAEPARKLETGFTAVARALNKAGALPEWRNELLDVFAHGQDTPLFRLERGAFRFFGFTTRCVHAVAQDREGRFLLGKRSSKKRVSPGLWDTLSGGLVAAGESLLSALQRETHEEAGLTPEQYCCGIPSSLLVEKPVETGWMREETVTFPIGLSAGAVPRNLDGEVEQFGAFTLVEIEELISAHRITTEAAVSIFSAAGLLQPL